MAKQVDSWAQFYRLIVGLLLLGALYIIWPYISSVVIMLVFAFLFTTVLLPFVDLLERKLGKRVLGVLIITLAVTGGIGLFIGSFISQFVGQAKAVYEQVSQYNIEEGVKSMVANLSAKMPTFLTAILPQGDELTEWLTGLASNVTAYFQNLISMAGSLAGSIGSAFFTGVMVIIFTVIVMQNYHNFKRSLVHFIPNKYFEVGLRLTFNIERQVSNYLRGQFMAAASVAIMSTIGLLILNAFGANLTLVVFIGIIAGLANLIPLVGPFVGMVPAILIAVMNNLGNEAAIAHKLIVIPSPFYFLDIVLMFIIVQQLDNNIITPKLVGESVGLHPLMVMIALLIGGTLLGPLGMLLAVPAAGIIKVIGQEIAFVSRNAHLL
ncbi:MAG: AI-2E family transporter, partial [Candidatus Marinimicrobia bacterium]|nr:AI-2E family transporter [Candidatus Neomarinimicrobiota bacterium]